MPNREYRKLAPAQRLAVDYMVMRARTAPGRQTADYVWGEVYAYQSAHGAIHWGINASGIVNTARGVFPAGKRETRNE